MRIRRRSTNVLHHAQGAPSSSQAGPPAAVSASSSFPLTPAAPCSGTSGARWVQRAAREADLSTRDAKLSDHRGRKPQEEEKAGSDETTKDEKRGKEDRRSDDQHPVDVIRSTRTGPIGCEEEGWTEVGEKKRESSRPAEHEEKTAVICKKGDGKGWHCKRAVQSGYSLCLYHLDKLRSYASYSQKKRKRSKSKSAPVSEKSSAAAVVDRQGASQKKTTKKRRMEQHGVNMEPDVSDSFYYYSGFGPRWGKRRGRGRSMDGDGVEPPNGDTSRVQLLQGTDDADGTAGEEEDECGYAGSSRDGKPLKSRALSSLL